MYIPELEYKRILEILPIICVDVFIIYDNKCLLLLRKNEPAINQYWVPGGRIYKLESIKDAAIRKAKEETNLDCEFVKIISVEESIFPKTENMTTDIHTVNVCCLMNVSNIENLKFDEHHSDFMWIDKQNEEYHNCVNNPLSLINF
jgi:colanic acid biosynthesis protein WcaH